MLVAMLQKTEEGGAHIHNSRELPNAPLNHLTATIYRQFSCACPRRSHAWKPLREVRPVVSTSVQLTELACQDPDGGM